MKPIQKESQGLKEASLTTSVECLLPATTKAAPISGLFNCVSNKVHVRFLLLTSKRILNKQRDPSAESRNLVRYWPELIPIGAPNFQFEASYRLRQIFKTPDSDCMVFWGFLGHNQAELWNYRPHPEPEEEKYKKRITSPSSGWGSKEAQRPHLPWVLIRGCYWLHVLLQLLGELVWVMGQKLWGQDHKCLHHLQQKWGPREKETMCCHFLK